MDNKQLKIAILDDHPMILEGLKAVLDAQEIYQIVTYSSSEQFCNALEKQQFDLILLDIVLPNSSGLELCKWIKTKYPKTLVLGISNQTERSIIMQFLQYGASGYILKNADVAEICSCIERALAGQIVFSTEVHSILAQHRESEIVIPKLTKREQQILSAIADGFTSAEIAEKLFVSTITIESHRRNLLQKFKAKNMMELVKIATQQRLI